MKKDKVLEIEQFKAGELFVFENDMGDGYSHVVTNQNKKVFIKNGSILLCLGEGERFNLSGISTENDPNASLPMTPIKFLYDGNVLNLFLFKARHTDNLTFWLTSET